MNDLFNNRFIQSLGIGALFYLLLHLLAFSLNSLLRIVETFAHWYRYQAMPHALLITVMATVAYLLVSAVSDSRTIQ